ncbi:MAG: SUMF1/EgtB/PvdO family nonheme iron enzyme [Bacteroidota bacterium]|nr:SUMF1/EgtB/PvdO family nonheme iron enzyme [Bacteroidota bacterium]
MNKRTITSRMFTILAVPFLLLAVLSCSDEQDTLDPTSTLAFEAYNIKTHICTYSLKVGDNCAVRSISIYKYKNDSLAYDSLMYQKEMTSRMSIDSIYRNNTLLAYCKYTPDGYNIRAEIKDFGGNVTRDTLPSQAVSSVQSPKSGDRWYYPTYQLLSWNSNFSDGVTLDLYKGQNYYQQITTGVKPISNMSNHGIYYGSYNWEKMPNLPAGNDYRIKVSSSVIPDAFAFSGKFTVVPYITITYPASSCSVFTGDNFQLNWNHNIDVLRIDLYKAGVFYLNIAGNVTASSYTWRIPATVSPGSNYTIRIFGKFDDKELYAETAGITVSSLQNQTITVNGVSFDMVAVAGGTNTLTMNSGFYVGQTEVTQALWKAVMGSNPSKFSGDNLPVEQVTWNACQTFITNLNQLTGKTFRMPSKDEWEYAARGGNQSKSYTYSGSNTLSDVAWYAANSNSMTHPVATKGYNELGLYDMSGNVLEWCQDLFGSSYRVCRGGSYIDASCKLSNLNSWYPDTEDQYIGLRLVASSL